MFGFFSKKDSNPQGEIKAHRNTHHNEYVSANTRAITTEQGFAVYKGEDILDMPQIKPLVIQLKKAFGGDIDAFNKHIYPSMRVLAAYCQFLPASKNRHHSNYLGLIIHSIEAAIVAMNYLRNCNVNFGVSPELRNEHTLAYKIACTLASLLHDVGKINDWNIITRVQKSSGITVEHKYNFIRSLPEFLAKAHQVDLSDVYGSPFDESKNIYVPKYEIISARTGRSNKHEIFGPNKMGIFISSATEELIADASYELYEDLQFFMYADFIDTTKISTNSLIAEIVTKADTESARFYDENHKGINGVYTTASMSEFSVKTDAPVINISVEKAPTTDVIAEQTTVSAVNNTQESVPEISDIDDIDFSDTKPTAPVVDCSTIDTSVQKNVELIQEIQEDKNSILDEPPVQTNLNSLDDVLGGSTDMASTFASFLSPTQTTSSHYNSNRNKLDEADRIISDAVKIPVEQIESTLNQRHQLDVSDFITDFSANVVDEEKKKTVLTAFTKAFDRHLTDTTTSMCLINQDKPNGFLFILGATLKGLKKNTYFCFLRLDQESKGFISEILSEVNQSTGIDLFKDIKTSNNDYLYRILLILSVYGIISYENNILLHGICPDAFWNQQNATLHFFDAVLLSHYTVAIPENSVLSECLNNFSKARILFEEPNNLSFLKDLTVLSSSGIINAATSREYQLIGRITQNPAKKEGDVTDVSASIDTSSTENKIEPVEDKTLYSKELAPAFNPEIEDKNNLDEQNKNTFASSYFRDVNRHKTTVNDTASIVREYEEDQLKEEVHRRILNNCNRFQADIDEEKQIKRLQNEQHFYYFNDDEIIELRAMSDDAKEAELNLIKDQIVSKLKNKKFEKVLFKEIDKALVLRSNYINFKEIANGNYYAAFIWSLRNQKKTAGFGAMFFNELLLNGLIPLCPDGDRTRIKDELEYFSCTILDPLISKYMILAGIEKSFRVEIKNWTQPNKTARDMLRYFEHLVIQCPNDQTVYGYPVTGNAITGLHISYEALKACVVELDCPAYESQRSRLLNLKNQSNPPYCWKEKDLLTISFFRKEDLEENIFKLQKKLNKK